MLGDFSGWRVGLRKALDLKVALEALKRPQFWVSGFINLKFTFMLFFVDKRKNQCLHKKFMFDKNLGFNKNASKSFFFFNSFVGIDNFSGPMKEFQRFMELNIYNMNLLGYIIRCSTLNTSAACSV